MSVRALRRGSMAGRGAAAAVNVLSLPGTTGNYVTTPDTAAASVTGDIDIRIKLAPANWLSTQLLVMKWPGSGNRSYYMYLGSTGLGAAFSTTGANQTFTNEEATGFTNGTPGWVRVTRVASSGAWTQYKSTDGSSWTTLNSGTLTSGNLFDNTAALAIGGRSDDGATPVTGSVYYAEVRAGIAGTIVASFDATAVTKLGTRNPSTVPVGGTAGGNWTINGSAWDWVSV